MLQLLLKLWSLEHSISYTTPPIGYSEKRDKCVFKPLLYMVCLQLHHKSIITFYC